MNIGKPQTLVTTWDEDRPTYRAEVWTRKVAPPGSDQEKIGWKLDSYELTEVADVREAIDWLEAKASEAGQRHDVNATASTLYAIGPRRTSGPGLIQLFGVNPTRGDT